MMKFNLLKFKKKFKINFKNEEIFYQALTHESYAHEKKEIINYEKLEFLGDTVLNLIITEEIYMKFPQLKLGELAKLKAQLISTAALVILAKKLKIGQYLFLGKGEEKSGGRNKDSILADSLEALIGAIYLDQGFNKAKEFVLREYLKIIEQYQSFDYKSALQEFIQKKHKKLPDYRVLAESGSPHQKEFKVGVYLVNKELGVGKGGNKKEAEQKAAKRALVKLNGT
ncbi:MAG: ribonuclease III [Armatimonadetes bacterium]|nr:ribonuclease III [Armatimonadota bacterium]